MPIVKETLDAIAHAYVQPMTSIRGRRVQRYEATVTTSYDLLKDSLPIVCWTICHPSFARIAGTLTIAGADLSQTDRSHIANLLRRVGVDDS